MFSLVYLSHTEQAYSSDGRTMDLHTCSWLFVRLAGAVGRQSALHQENSGFAAPTLGRHIFTFRGYRIGGTQVSCFSLCCK
jgi:hypothetical protein